MGPIGPHCISVKFTCKFSFYFYWAIGPCKGALGPVITIVTVDSNYNPRGLWPLVLVVELTLTLLVFIAYISGRGPLIVALKTLLACILILTQWARRAHIVSVNGKQC